MAASAKNRKTFKRLLLNGWIVIGMFFGVHLSKLLKSSHSAEQDGRPQEPKTEKKV